MGKAREAMLATPQVNSFPPSVTALLYEKMASEKTQFFIEKINFNKEGKHGPFYGLQIIITDQDLTKLSVLYGADNPQRSAMCEAVMSDLNERPGEVYGPCVFTLTPSKKGSPLKGFDDVDEGEEPAPF